MKALLFYICFALIWLLSLLPLKVLYIFSDITYLLIYYILRYRRKIVRKNLCLSFPDKTKEEIIKIEKRFYLFFCDVFIEAFKLLHFSGREIEKRMKFHNLEWIMERMDKGQNVFVMLGHYGNWEWVSSFAKYVDKEYIAAQIYHPLKNKYWDKFFLDFRERFGAVSIPMKQTFREIISNRRKGKVMAIGFIADQSPKAAGLDFWTPFLNQETAFLTGAERIAKQTDAALIYLDMKRVRRGYYEATMVPMSDTPKDTEEFELTRMYANMMEKTIIADPAYWLWTHKRWKYSKETNNHE